jgi:hypothetical protein
MWTNEHSIETAASPDAIWRLWSDVAGWPEWNADIEHIEISGPFAPGSTITMTPIGQDPIELRIGGATMCRSPRPVCERRLRERPHR